MQTTKFLVGIGAAAALIVPSTVVAGPDSEAQAKLREAMRQKMEELNAQAAPVSAPMAPPAPQPKEVIFEPAPAPRPVTVVVPVPVESTPAAPRVESVFTPVDSAAAETQNDQLLQALRAKLAEEKATNPAPVVAAPVAPARPAAVSAAPVLSIPLTANMEAPPSPFSSSKQSRLAELLRRYEADQITPLEYHTQRAQIIAE